MQEQKTKQNEVGEIESSLKLIGYCSIKGVDYLQSIKQQDIIHELISKVFNKHKKDYSFHPIKLYSTPNCIAIIDSKSKLWLINDAINQPICISDMIKLKVNDLALTYHQMIINTSEGQLLLTWGGKKYFCEKQLCKLTIKNQRFKYLHFFQLYQIKKDCTKYDRFYYSHNQKINSQAIVYHLTKNNSIITYPSQNKIEFKRKIIGISLGKYHNLIWDNQGKLYSWGCRSIALGYQALPDSQIIEQPREVDLLKHHIIKAFAGSNYSLAVTLEGKLYQWGINKINPKKQEIIFEPKQVREPMTKYIQLKGKGEMFGALSLSGQLYIWGKNSRIFNEQTNKNKEDYVQPTLINKNIDFVVDFTIEDSFILLITMKENLQTYSSNRKMYWANLKNSIQQNLKGLPKESPSPSVRSKIQLSTFRKYNDPIEVAFQKRKAKQSYILSTLQPQKTIKYLMEPTQHSACSSNIINDISFECFNKQNRKSQERSISKRLRTTIDDFSNEFKKQKEYIQILVNKVQSMKVHPGLIRFNRNKNPTVRPQKVNDSYQAKLQSVRRRKDQNEHIFIEQTVRKVQNRSFQFRIAKKLQIEQAKKRAKECQLYKQSLQKFIIKQFMIKLLTKPIAEGRQVKIATFARYLKIERLQKRIRGLFIRTRVKFNMRKLHHHQIFRFFLLTMTFQQYVKRFRFKKTQKLRKMVVGQIFKGVIRQKIKIGITACNFSIRKLQKFREWLSLVKIERKRCLKYIWKVHLLSIMRINTDSESSAIFYLPKNFQEMTFEALYQQKVCMNPLLKLSNFLSHHSIFKIKTTIFQQLFLLTKESKTKQKSSRMIKGLTKSRKFRIKFSQDDDDKQQRFNLIQTDILPYSLHYNIIIHPKNYDITIPQIMKVSEKWIRQQRKILDKHIELIIKNHQMQYIKQRRNYDVDLAHFIRKNYQFFGQKRWKFILEYNQIEKNHSKKKKEKEIRRIMKLIGAQNILDQDCIPQKQIILDEVFKRTDAPSLPNPYINFGPSQFKKLFKSYYEAVSCKSKALVRATLPL